VTRWCYTCGDDITYCAFRCTGLHTGDITRPRLFQAHTAIFRQLCERGNYLEIFDVYKLEQLQYAAENICTRKKLTTGSVGMLC